MLGSLLLEEFFIFHLPVSPSLFPRAIVWKMSLLCVYTKFIGRLHFGGISFCFFFSKGDNA